MCLFGLPRTPITFLLQGPQSFLLSISVSVLKVAYPTTTLFILAPPRLPPSSFSFLVHHPAPA